MAKDIFVGYHGFCPDGWASAYVAWKFFGDRADYVPLSYGYPPPDLSDYHFAYLLDFSYKQEELEDLKSQVNALSVIDHHKSNAHLDELSYAHFDLSHSGAVLTWKQFYGDDPVPELLKYVEDRDLWKWELPYSREVCAALSSYRVDFRGYDELVKEFEAEINSDVIASTRLAKEGSAILRFQNVLVEEICDQAVIDSFDNYENVPIVATPILHSDVGNVLLKKYPDAPFSVTTRVSKDGIRSFSLRSMDDREDVSVIAKRNGGGGHRNAAGFEVDLND